MLPFPSVWLSFPHSRNTFRMLTNIFFFQFSPEEGGCKRLNQSIGLTARDRLLFTLTRSGLEFQVLRRIPETTTVNPYVNGTSCISSALPNLTQVLCSLFHPFYEMCTKAKLYRPYSHDYFPLMYEAQMLLFKSFKHWQNSIISADEKLKRQWKLKIWRDTGQYATKVHKTDNHLSDISLTLVLSNILINVSI